MENKINNKGRKHFRIKTIVGVLCICVGILFCGAQLSGAWQNSFGWETVNFLHFKDAQSMKEWNDLQIDPAEAVADEQVDDFEVEEVWYDIEEQTGEVVDGPPEEIWAEIGESGENETELNDEGSDRSADSDDADIESADNVLGAAENADVIGDIDTVEDIDAEIDIGADGDAGVDDAVHEVWSYDVGYVFDSSDDD